LERSKEKMATPRVVKKPPLRPRLISRPLDPKADPALLSTVTFGSEPWAREVEAHLRDGQKAVLFEERGICATTLFLPPDEEQVVGFYSTAGIKLRVGTRFLKSMEISKRKAPWKEVDACYLVAFGVNEKYQRQGYAPEIHLALIESLCSGAMRPRFMYLKVWADNPAARLYEKWGYKRLRKETAVRKEDGAELTRLRMALKVR
jgi:ribosomal protein S18 acetylase RimI-like enzyme